MTVKNIKLSVKVLIISIVLAMDSPWSLSNNNKPVVIAVDGFSSHTNNNRGNAKQDDNPQGFFARRQIKKEEERQRKERNRQYVIESSKRIEQSRELNYQNRKKTNQHLRNAAHLIAFVNTVLFFWGGMATPALALSMISLKLLQCIDHTAYDGKDDENGRAGAKSMVGLFFAGTAICFKSRSMEKSGGVILLFIQWMNLK